MRSEEERRKKREYYHKNKEAFKARVAKYKSKPETRVKLKEYNRRSDLKKRGLTIDSYDRQYSLQEGCCAICEKAEISCLRQKLDVDHDHNTGDFRGLLCNSCNTGLGQFKDNPFLLQQAIKYLAGYATLGSKSIKDDGSVSESKTPTTQAQCTSAGLGTADVSSQGTATKTQV